MQSLAATTIDMPGGTFDLDGDIESVNLNSNLTLNVASIDNDDANLFESTLTIQSFAKLTVNLTNPADEWTGALFEHTRGGIAMRGERVVVHQDGTRRVTKIGDPVNFCTRSSQTIGMITGLWPRENVLPWRSMDS